MRLRALAAVVFTLGAAFACSSSYSGTDATGADGSPTSDAAADAATNPTDAGDNAPGTVDGGPCSPAAPPTCVPGTCAIRTLYASSNGYPFDIVTDPAFVYWIEQRTGDAGADPYNGDGEGRILRTDRVGAVDASRATVLAQNLPHAHGLALDRSSLYVTTSETVGGGGTAVHLYRVPTACSAPPCPVEEIALSPSIANTRFERLFRAAPDVLWALTVSGDLYRVAIQGSAAKAVLVDSATIYTDAVLTGEAAYLGGSASPAIHRISLDGTTVNPTFATIGDAGAGLVRLATDCTTLYGSIPSGSASGDAIVSISTATKSASIRAAKTGFAFYQLGADARYVYGAGVNAGGLIVIDPDGGVTNVQAANVFALAVDDQGVYFGDHAGSGHLMMMVK